MIQTLEMASRKRKVSASRPQANYDTTRFTSEAAWDCYADNVLAQNILSKRNVRLYVTEYDDFKRHLEQRNWNRHLTNLIPFMWL